MSEGIKEKRYDPQDQYPISTTDVRVMALEAAGFNPVEAGTIFRKAINKLEEKLSATKVQYFTDKGVVTDERVTEDNAIQVKAAEDLAQIAIDTMALRKRAASDTPTPSSVNIDLSGWTVQSPPPIKRELLSNEPKAIEDSAE